MSVYGPKRHLDRFIRFSTAADARNQQTHTQTDHATTVTVGRVLCYTIQCSKSIYNARMVSLRAESEARAVARGRKMARHGSKGRHGENNVSYDSSQKKQTTSYCEFREGVYSTVKVLHD